MTNIGYDTSKSELAAVCERASVAAEYLRRADRCARAVALRAAAEALDSQRESLVEIARAETRLGEARLDRELARTSYQLRHFASVVENADYLEVLHDQPMDTPMGAQPDLRRYLVALGPVAVFGAGNFPFAFSVPGGDTVAAVAAGCPVVVKLHPDHPRTSIESAAVLIEAFLAAGLPADTLQLVGGLETGRDLVVNSAIKAVTFTGSLSGGRALMEAIAERDDPIPFFGELGSVNPVIVLRAAASTRGQEIGNGLAVSGTVDNGQLCTQPQLVYIPREVGDEVVDEMLRVFTGIDAQDFLTDAGGARYAAKVADLRIDKRITALTSFPSSSRCAPTLLTTSCSNFPKKIYEEVFGPLQVVVRYDSDDELFTALRALPGSLTATLHADDADSQLALQVLTVLETKVGRLVFNGYPTGVMVAGAQTHGGPWPSSNSQHSSVGATSIRRFLRPITYQSAPSWALPAELGR